ncbi:type III-A CRISPR-associated protein Csm2 [Deltaproteobacteria bacterium TL4]
MAQQYQSQRPIPSSHNQPQRVVNSNNPIQYYTDDKKEILNASLLTDEAQNNAKLFVENKLKSAQLRRFFNTFRALERKVSKKDYANFEQVKPLIKMQKAYAAYAKQKIPESFRIFINRNVDSIETKEDFKAFMLYFESVVGYCYGEGMKD